MSMKLLIEPTECIHITDSEKDNGIQQPMSYTTSQECKRYDIIIHHYIFNATKRLLNPTFLKLSNDSSTRKITPGISTTSEMTKYPAALKHIINILDNMDLGTHIRKEHIQIYKVYKYRHE